MNHMVKTKFNRPIAFFDFDGTLTTKDTLMPFLKFVVGKPVYYIKLFAISPVLIAYFLKLIRNDVAKQLVLKWYLSGYSIDELFDLGNRFSQKIIPGMLRTEGMERLRWHQQQGHECILVSASLDIYLESWVKMENINALLSSQLAVKKDCITGKLKGGNCFGEQKVQRILEWLNGRLPPFIYAYGNSKGDESMLMFANEGFLFKKKQGFIKING